VRLGAACCSGPLAGVLAKLNDVAFRVDSVTHRDAVERPFSIGWLHDSAMRLGNHSETRDARHKEDWLECYWNPGDSSKM